VRRLAVIGHLARDVVNGGAPRIGGAPWYAGRALRVLGRPAHIAAKCGEADRRRFLSQLTQLGLPVRLVTGGETTEFVIDYDVEPRRMSIGAVGEPWSAAEAVRAVGRAEWVQVAPLMRSDFPVETLAALGRGRRLLLDAQGLVRVPQTGPLQFDTRFDPAVLDAVSMLKIAEEEAIALTGSIDDIVSLGVPEVIVTLGTRGCILYARGRVERVPARPLDGVKDPTGAGDGFGAAYLAARAEGHAPASAARRATALVGGLLSGRAR